MNRHGGTAAQGSAGRRAFDVVVHADYLGRWVFEVLDVARPRVRVERLRDVRPAAIELIADACGLEASDVHVVVRYREPSSY